RVIVPHRVANALYRDETQVVTAAKGVDVISEEDARGEPTPFRPHRERLDSNEVEFTAVVKGLSGV
ncbi:hypothetical protein BGZ82_000893, partial [Podila clonocystis]